MNTEQAAMKKQTALQELISHLENQISKYPVKVHSFTVREKESYDAITQCLNLAKNLLPKERADIEDAYENGYGDGFDRRYILHSDYFTQTFNTDKQ